MILNPDQEVQARLRLIFDKFTELGSAHAVREYLRRGLRCEILSKVRRDRWQLPLGRDTEQLVNKFPLSHHVTLS